MRSVALLGATGSIGQQTLDVLRTRRDEYTLLAVSAASRVEQLIEVAREFGVAHVGVAHESSVTLVREALGPRVEIHVGETGLGELATLADVVVNAVVGFAGLPVTLAALMANRRLALANKESLIAAAPLVAHARLGGGEILPIDSEHCAIHQCLTERGAPGRPDVRTLWLTASGGPFRGYSAEQLGTVTRADALRHPTWSMGDKITIDSSTLMNKGLEVLEASALFDIDLDRIDVVVHPESLVHSMVEYTDSSVIAQLSTPDMRLPIAYCLSYPNRATHDWGRMDFATTSTMHFEAPNRALFGALDLAYAAGRRGGVAPAWLSAANEVAVAAFLNDEIRWVDIVPLVASVLDECDDVVLDDVATLLAADARARELATRKIAVR